MGNEVSMKAAEMSSGDPFLPIEILSDVLKRLPVKSLIRFQSVCSHWKDLINSPSFIASHLDHSDRENPSLISRRQNTLSGTSIPYLLDRDTQLRQVPKNPLSDSLKDVIILGSCNGLLCVQTGRSGYIKYLYLWNPAIREVMHVPRSRSSMDSPYILCLGFAFSPTINDYKIVIPYVTLGLRDELEYGFEAYSLTTNSWKHIGMGSLNALIGMYPFTDCITLNGSIFWLASQKDLVSHGGDNPNVILWLYLATDEFRLIPLPPSSKNEIATLTVYEHRLAVFHNSSGCTENSLIDLWVIEEGIGISWSKILSCGPYPHIVVPLTIWRNQIICDVFPKHSTEGNDDNDAAGSFLFDPTSNEVKVLYSGREGILHTVFTYAESLVSISNIHTGKH
ncbi:unnamed protein product [Cuscuta epithymum]|uniref:F-box domain-containing protein n=1 Tax=Cuscuta epithymum TaxID=186058 RepID=A0AAV0G352_9ASTE|nr:unnamed protein product [Cuscuta epithymum]